MFAVVCYFLVQTTSFRELRVNILHLLDVEWCAAVEYGVTMLSIRMMVSMRCQVVLLSIRLVWMKLRSVTCSNRVNMCVELYYHGTG